MYSGFLECVRAENSSYILVEGLFGQCSMGERI